MKKYWKRNRKINTCLLNTAEANDVGMNPKR